MIGKKQDLSYLKALIHSMADGVIATNKNGTIDLYNGAALNILDSNQTIDQMNIDKVLLLLDTAGNNIHIPTILKDLSAQFISRDYRLQYSDGSFVNLYISIAPVRYTYGKNLPQGFVFILRDITREKSLEEERDEFISVISHELRTPVAIAEGNVSNAQFVLEKQDGDELLKTAINQAHQQIIFLSGLINDLSTLSRAENNKLKIETTDINVVELVKSLQKDYHEQAHAKGLELEAHTDDGLELLRSSQLYVHEILQNFLTNSIKYTDEGKVLITAEPYKNGVLFTVSDTGIGISKSDQERIFNKFFRSEDYRTRKNSGTGIGLYVTKKLAALLGAEIDVSSKLNHGSNFRIYIPNITDVA